ncbi:hypothetical protein NL676_037471 [Syzygium grande]|nr:hypothetical protein NL676_037471 [Syzygium grande]
MRIQKERGTGIAKRQHSPDHVPTNFPTEHLTRKRQKLHRQLAPSLTSLHHRFLLSTTASSFLCGSNTFASLSSFRYFLFLLSLFIPANHCSLSLPIQLQASLSASSFCID